MSIEHLSILITFSIRLHNMGSGVSKNFLTKSKYRGVTDEWISLWEY